LPHPIAAELDELASRIAAAMGFGVKGVQVLSHRIPLTVQVLVKRADGGDVSLDECAALSAPLGEAIEAAGLLEMAYVLEVSSPGVGEELLSDRDFTSFRGFPVQVRRRATDGAETAQEGLLLGRDDQAVLLNIRGRSLRLPRNEVVGVRLISPTADP
jgi:ribosome maturation factor RimP